MDNYLQKLLREYTISPSDELAHRISHAMLRSRASSTEQNFYCPRCRDSTVFSGLDSGLYYCTECNWDVNQPTQVVQIHGTLCNTCQVPEHSTCALISGCPCCEDTVANMGGIAIETLYASEDEDAPEDEDEDEDEDDDEEDEHAAEYEAGEFWDCANCGAEPFFEDTQGETWALLGEAGAAVANNQLGRGDAGQALCENCAIEAGLDLEQAAQDVLEGFCEECGEEEDDCECESRRPRRNPNPDRIMYRGARQGDPEILTGPSFFISLEGFARTYGQTAAFYLDLQNPKEVDPNTWLDTVGMLEYMPMSDKIQFNEDLEDEGYDSIIAYHGGPADMVVVYLLDPSLAELI